MTSTDTLRTHLEAIRDVSCEEYQSPDSMPSFETIRQIYSDAVAALEIVQEIESHLEPIHLEFPHPDGHFGQHIAAVLALITAD